VGWVCCLLFLLRFFLVMGGGGGGGGVSFGREALSFEVGFVRTFLGKTKCKRILEIRTTKI